MTDTPTCIPDWVLWIVADVIIRSDDGVPMVAALANGLPTQGWEAVADRLVDEATSIYPAVDAREYAYLKARGDYGHAVYVLCREAAEGFAAGLKPGAGEAWYFPQAPAWGRIGRALITALPKPPDDVLHEEDAPCSFVLAYGEDAEEWARYASRSEAEAEAEALGWTEWSVWRSADYDGDGAGPISRA